MVLHNGDIHANGVEPHGNKQVTQTTTCTVLVTLSSDLPRLHRLALKCCSCLCSCARRIPSGLRLLQPSPAAVHFETHRVRPGLQIRFPSVHDDTVSLTTNVGTPVVSNQHSESMGRRGRSCLTLSSQYLRCRPRPRMSS